jgi:hypothetical protein
VGPWDGAERGRGQDRLSGSLLLRVDDTLKVALEPRKGSSCLHPKSSVAASRARDGSRPDERDRAAAVLRSGGGAAVLAQQSTQPSHHNHLTVTIADRGIAGRWPKVEAAVRPSPVVVLDVLLQDAPEVAVVDDKKPVQRLPAS